ncbi:HupE/UreJ family protein [Lewinella sp. 4G2]|uniref:HupE/UreJ family protein n=1 Tax=Lewinella sp. 4G2 TaxID=1803372 RepID=UPI0018D2881C|nr:HupE/UreJ family protein [Lewinella sp. 4G2]
MLRLTLIGVICLLGFQKLAAHKADESYVFLKIYNDHIDGHYQITAGDLNLALGLNLTDDLDEAQIQPYLPRIHQYLKENCYFKSAAGDHPMTFTTVSFMPVSYGTFVNLDFKLANTEVIPDELEVKFDIIYDKKPRHRNKLIQAYNWKAGITKNEAMISLAFSPGNGVQTLDLTSRSVLKGFWGMIVSGMYHIYIGLDHILFLLALLLPAVVRRKKGATGILNSWEPVEEFRPAFMYVLKIVTFFTIAHTITLSLAALDVVSLPSRIVESLIALSIALAAIHNIKPFRENETVGIAFVFGLFHGFGFASVLGEVGLSGEFMVLSLLGFNIGVELAQVIIICLAFPALFFLRKSKYYKPVILIGGSIFLIAIACYWFIERFFEVDLVIGGYVERAIKKVKRIFS